MDGAHLKGDSFMGYTHYWRVKKIKGMATVLEARYQKAILECQKVCSTYYKEFGGLSGYSAHTKPGAYGGLKVNGKGDDGHEDFVMREHFNENEDFEFCKTARKSYDLVVTACLAILKHRLGHAIEVSSDGDAADWTDGVNYAREVTGLKIKNPLGEVFECTCRAKQSSNNIPF